MLILKSQQTVKKTHEKITQHAKSYSSLLTRKCEIIGFRSSAKSTAIDNKVPYILNMPGKY